MATHVSLKKFDPDLLADVPGLTLPSVENRSYALLDDDDKVCRRIDEDELEASYVDNGIDTFRLLDVNVLTLNVDDQAVRLTYADGRTVDLPLGAIKLNAPVRAGQYGQWHGIIYAIDDAGNILLDATNTPHLADIRRWYLAEAKRVNDQRIEIAEVVHAFAEIIGESAHAGHLGH
jgi:hypothetical protein